MNVASVTREVAVVGEGVESRARAANIIWARGGPDTGGKVSSSHKVMRRSVGESLNE